MKKAKIIITICIIILGIISVINIYNAKYLNTIYENYYLKQLLWYILSFIIFFIIIKFNLNNIFKLSYILYFLNIILLIIVLFIGHKVNGTKGWLKIFGFSFQPSELMKLSLNLTLINVCFKKERNIINIIKLIFLTLLPSILVFLEPDTGAIIFYFIIFLTIIILKRLPKKYYFCILISTIICTLALLYCYQNHLISSLNYRIERILNYKESYQIDMAKTAIYSTLIIRNGINNINLYIPEGLTDFILDFIIGNFGYTSLIIISLLYLVLLYKIANLINTYNNKKTNYLIISFLVIFFIQIFINFLMNFGLIPIIGITLPFLSYGGTSTLLYFLYLGIIFNLTKKV